MIIQLYGTVLNNQKRSIHNLKKSVNIFSVLIDDIYGNTCDGKKRRYESTSVLRFRCPDGFKPPLLEGEKVLIEVTPIRELHTSNLGKDLESS